MLILLLRVSIFVYCAVHPTKGSQALDEQNIVRSSLQVNQNTCEVPVQVRYDYNRAQSYGTTHASLRTTTFLIDYSALFKLNARRTSNCGLCYELYFREDQCRGGTEVSLKTT